MVYIVGIGPGNRDYILPKALEIMQESDIILGFGRAMESVDFIDKKKIKVSKISEVVEELEKNKDKVISVVASGDPLYYGITEYIKNNYPGEIKVIPGISSFQYLSGRLNKSWQGAYLGSLHGREEEFINKVRENKLSIWLTDSKNSPKDLAQRFLEEGLNPRMYVGENLSYEDEKIEIGYPEEMKNKEFSSLCVLLLENEEASLEGEKLAFISDEDFIRGNCPMTKEEIRILSIAKMNLYKNSRVLDVGAGTGSISIQAAKICSQGEVVALEKDSDALEVIYKNKEKFKADNLIVIEGEALTAKLEGKFNSIFIGGSGGNLSDLIKKYCEMLMDGGKIVLNFITINNLYIAMNTLVELGYKVKCTQVSVSKTKGQTYMLMANNPIFIIEGEKNNG